MDTAVDVTLWIHILFGHLTLLAAPGAMLTRKGSRWHRRWGKAFFWALMVVALTAVALSLARSNLFLLLVAVFSFYLAYSGYAVLSRKLPHHRARPADWVATTAMLVGGVMLVAYGIYLIPARSFGIVAVVFGTAGLAVAGFDVHSYLRPAADPRAWWFAHMTRMLAAYIATVSAFSVVNFEFLPPLVRWLWPAAVGSIGIAVWRRHYRRRFSTPGAWAASTLAASQGAERNPHPIRPVV
jgi:hypothetical protein